jgi:ketosteroid isomerase-like protein
MSEESTSPDPAAAPEALAAFIEGWECYNRHDFDAMAALYSSDAVLDMSRVYLDERPRRGHEDMRAYWEEMWEISGGMRIEPVEVLDVGGDRYVVVVKYGQRGKRSGADVGQELACLYALHDGLVARLDLFPDRDAALAAARLAE